MADTEQQDEMVSSTDAAADIMPEEVETYSFWDNDTKTVPEEYVRAFTVNSDPIDVKLLFGNTYKEGGLRVDLCKIRLVMTHRAFLELAEEIGKEAAFLKKLYKGKNPGPDPTPEEFNAALEEVYGDD